MKIKIYSKPGCGKCEAAKEKLKIMGYEYEEHLLEYHINPHFDWRINGSRELLAWAAYHGDPREQLPIIEVRGEFYDYSAAMKLLKVKK